MLSAVIINADDLGLSPEENAIIVRAFRSVLIHADKLLGRIGLHFNLSYGRPLSAPLRLARNLGGNIGPAKRLFKILLNQRLRRLGGRCAEHVCTPADLRDQPLPAQGTLEVIAHPSALGEDFGDACLGAGESLSALLDRCLAGVPRIAYSALTKL